MWLSVLPLGESGAASGASLIQSGILKGICLTSENADLLKPDVCWNAAILIAPFVRKGLLDPER